MNSLMMLTSMILSNLFYMTNHPISLVIVILLQTLIICFLIISLTSLSWFSVMIFLIFLGGLMVLFIYIASLAANEMFNFSLKITILLAMMMFLTVLAIYMFFETNLFMYESLSYKMIIGPIYSKTMINPTIIAMVYLLIALLVTVNIIKLYEAPMRSLI